MEIKLFDDVGVEEAKPVPHHADGPRIVRNLMTRRKREAVKLREDEVKHVGSILGYAGDGMHERLMKLVGKRHWSMLRTVKFRKLGRNVGHSVGGEEPSGGGESESETSPESRMLEYRRRSPAYRVSTRRPMEKPTLYSPKFRCRLASALRPKRLDFLDGFCILL